MYHSDIYLLDIFLIFLIYISLIHLSDWCLSVWSRSDILNLYSVWSLFISLIFIFYVFYCLVLILVSRGQHGRLDQHTLISTMLSPGPLFTLIRVIRYLLDMTEVRTMSWFRSYWMRRLIDSVMCWICIGNNSFRVHCWLSSVVSNGFDRPSSFDLKRMIILRLSYIIIKKFTHLKISHFQNFVLIKPKLHKSGIIVKMGVLAKIRKITKISIKIWIISLQYI